MSSTIVVVWPIIVMFLRPTDAEGGVTINICKYEGPGGQYLNRTSCQRREAMKTQGGL